jgi:CheY-like chemotaxis protein
MTQVPSLYVVDDAADYRFLVQQVFTLFLPAYRVHFFADGAELVGAMDGLAAVNVDKPRVIVLDLDMPQLDGFQTLVHLKQHPYWQPVPVVIMSNRRDWPYQQESLRLGASAFVAKPMDLMAIKRAMTLLCEHTGNFGSLSDWLEEAA